MEYKLLAEARVKKEKLDRYHLPAVLYGNDIESTMLKLNYNVFAKIFAEAGESNLITLQLDKQEFPVLVKDFQKDVLKGTFIHVDFYKVNMKEKVKAEIPLEFVGVAKAIKEKGGIFLVNVNEVEVECLPSDLVDHIDVDISNLNEFGDMIRFEDLALPKGLELMREGNEVICIAEEPRKIEEVVEEAPADGATATTVNKEENKEEKKEEESK